MKPPRLNDALPSLLQGGDFAVVFQKACPHGKKNESNTSMRVERCFFCPIWPLNASKPEYYSLQDPTQQIHVPVTLYTAVMLPVATMLGGSHVL